MPWSALLSTWCDRREHWLFPAPTATTMLFLIAAGSLCAHDLRACSEEVNLMQTRASGAAEATPATMLVLQCAAWRGTSALLSCAVYSSYSTAIRTSWVSHLLSNKHCNM